MKNRKPWTTKSRGQHFSTHKLYSHPWRQFSFTVELIEKRVNASRIQTNIEIIPLFSYGNDERGSEFGSVRPHRTFAPNRYIYFHLVAVPEWFQCCKMSRFHHFRRLDGSKSQAIWFRNFDWAAIGSFILAVYVAPRKHKTTWPDIHFHRVRCVELTRQ